MKLSTKIIAQSGMLSALAIGLSAIEMILPTSALLPAGCKIGFSNLATMMAAKNVSFFSAFCVTLLKSVFVLITRGFIAFLLSLAGGLFSTAVIILIFHDKKSRFGCIGAGVIGAAAHNTAQICIYSLFVGISAWYYLPILLAFGTISGIFTKKI
ncbi:MAG: Gx transporter family protein [Clostridia bacterium]